MVKKFHLNTSLDIMIRGHSKSTFVDERGGALKNEQKRTGGRGCPSMCVVRCFSLF